MTPDEPNTPDVAEQAPAATTDAATSAPAATDATPVTTSPTDATPFDATPTDATPTEAQEAAAEDEGPEGGEEEPGAEGEAKTEGQTGEKKKRRRRRRKKKEGAQVEGAPAEGAEGAPRAEGQPKAEGEEGEQAEGAPAEGEARAGGEGGKKGKRGGRPSREKPPFSVGEETAGKVTSVLPDAIMLDVAGKALGIFDRKEIPESETPAEGEILIGKVSNDGARGGCVVLTKDLNRWQKARLEVEAAFNEKRPVDGLVTGVIKGGVEIDVDGLRGFAPASHVDLRMGADLHHLIGQRLSFEVVQFAKRGREFVLSRKGALESEAKELRAQALEHVKVGEIVKGTVRSIQPFGAFIDVGGIDGLCPPNEASHEHKRMDEVFKVGEEIDVKILRVDEHGKIWLSKRAAEHDPWEGAGERYARGTRHKGKVVRLQPFGAFIELEAGIDGLLHVSDIFAPRRINHPNEVLKVGEELDVVVSRLELEQRRIGLHEAPKEGEAPVFEGGGREGGRGGGAGRLGPHAHVKAVVEAHEPGGLVVRIVGQTGRNAKGFIPAPATGTAKGTDLRKAFPVGTEVEAKVVEFDPKRPTKLSIKALGQDQERQAFRQYQNEVKQASKFGTFGDLLRNKGITK
ncbi:MAG: S1 RNA-binding domain-containing protein [Deltaproteobacteria bacterium]|nr:S1 RNA-binding domain-containing protein [Deltaproteobacteria bacterium]